MDAWHRKGWDSQSGNDNPSCKTMRALLILIQICNMHRQNILCSNVQWAQWGCCLIQWMILYWVNNVIWQIVWNRPPLYACSSTAQTDARYLVAFPVVFPTTATAQTAYTHIAHMTWVHHYCWWTMEAVWLGVMARLTMSYTNHIICPTILSWYT